MEGTDFSLSSTFSDKNISGDSCSAYTQAESVLKENCNQTDWTVYHLKQLQITLLDKSKDYLSAPWKNSFYDDWYFRGVWFVWESIVLYSPAK